MKLDKKYELCNSDCFDGRGGDLKATCADFVETSNSTSSVFTDDLWWEGVKETRDCCACPTQIGGFVSSEIDTLTCPNTQTHYPIPRRKELAWLP